MYLNQFDFFYNVVGIVNVLKVYFNKKLKDFIMDEVVMFVGMCKNLILYNLYIFKIKDYCGKIVVNLGIDLKDVGCEDICKVCEVDSFCVVNCCNMVLFQWLKNFDNEDVQLWMKFICM